MSTPANHNTNDEKKDDIALLYDAFSKINEATDKSTETKSYEFLLDSVKGESKVKQLAAQFIPRFFSLYPDLAERAINAQLDLCEDEEMQVRVYAIRGLADICKGTPQHVQRIADVLGQLLLTEEAIELQTVKRTFNTLFELDIKATFTALFQQIKDGDDQLREKGIEFVKNQITQWSNKIKKDEDLQKHLASGIKKVLTHESGVTGEEFKLFLGLLKSFKFFETDKSYPLDVAKIIVNQSGLEKKFDPTNEEYIQKQFIPCLAMASQLFPKGADNAPFMLYFAKHMLPVFDQISEKSRFWLLKAISEASRYTSVDTARQILEPIYETLKKHIPKQAATGSEKPKFLFQFIECLLYIFHQLAAKDPGFVRNICGVFIPTGQPTDFSSGNMQEKKEDFFARLDYLKQNLKMDDLKQVTSNIRKKIKELKDEKDEEEKKKLMDKLEYSEVAQRTSHNINTLVKNLQKKIPVFMAGDSIRLSWKTNDAQNIARQERQKRQMLTNARNGQAELVKKGLVQQGVMAPTGTNANKSTTTTTATTNAAKPVRKRKLANGAPTSSTENSATSNDSKSAKRMRPIYNLSSSTNTTTTTSEERGRGRGRGGRSGRGRGGGAFRSLRRGRGRGGLRGRLITRASRGFRRGGIRRGFSRTRTWV